MPHRFAPGRRSALLVGLCAAAWAGCAAEPLDGTRRPSSVEPTWPRYPRDRVLSPLSPSIVAGLRAIARRGSADEPTPLSPTWGAPRDNVFIKVGDSISAYDNFLACYTAEEVTPPATFDSEHLDKPAFLAAVAHFAAGRIPVRDAETGELTDSVDPFRRRSHTACGGWYSDRPLRADGKVCAGPPGEKPVDAMKDLAPLERELRLARPRFAVMMFGSNDVGTNAPAWYGGNMRRNVERLLEEGVIPVLSTIPARPAAATGAVAIHNEIVRALAERHGLPLVDLNLALSRLPNKGLSVDGVHLSYVPGDTCDFAAERMYGQNLRNLVTMEMLARLHQVLVADPAAAAAVATKAPPRPAPHRLRPDGEEPPAAPVAPPISHLDAEPAQRAGSGSPDDPYRLDEHALASTARPVGLHRRREHGTRSFVAGYDSPRCGRRETPGADDTFEIVAAHARISAWALSADWKVSAQDYPRRVIVERCEDEGCTETTCLVAGAYSAGTYGGEVGRRFRIVVESPPEAPGDYFLMLW